MKHFAKSKTIITCALLFAASFSRHVQAFLRANPEVSAQLAALIFATLRAVTHGKLSLGFTKDENP